MKTKHNYLTLFLALSTFVVSVVSMFFMPDTIPTHWNFYGEIDGYGSKYLILFIGSLGLMCYFLMNVTKKMDPLEEKINQKIESYYLMRDIIVMLMAVLTFVFISGVLIEDFNMSSAITVALGLFLIVIGNYMPRVPHNYYLGVKTPWALVDESNWKKTQRFGGYVFCICGALMTIFGLMNWKIGMIVSLIALIILSTLTYVYSWYIFKHSK